MNIIKRIQDANAGRDPERLKMKYRNMRDNPFVFLRGTCHLFYDRLPDVRVLERAPATWVCGDLHLENYGSYKGDNRLVYFDMNDFDEAALAPCTWELVRFLASVLCAARSLRANRPEAMALCQGYLDAYAAALEYGKPRWVERETAQGLVKQLLDGLQGRLRVEFLDRRSDRKGRRRTIRLDGEKALPVTDAQREKVESFMKQFARQQENPGFYKVRDVARRVAGTGSLGVERYAILVEGKGSPDGNYLLDLKQAMPSSLVRHLKLRQPQWETEAQRVVAVQRRMQAVSVAFLHPVTIGRTSYVLRGLQPDEDRVDLTAWNKRLRRLEGVMQTMGQVAAWGQLRASGRQGSAIADELIDFGRSGKWKKPLLAAAEHCCEQVENDWRFYCIAYDDGQFKT